PAGWVRSENERIGGATFDFILRGPVHNNFQTNILVDSISDATLREDRESMANLVSDLINQLRSDDPSLTVTEAPAYRTVSADAVAAHPRVCPACANRLQGSYRFCACCGSPTMPGPQK